MPIIISKLCMIFSKPFILYPSTQVNASENVSNSNRAFSPVPCNHLTKCCGVCVFLRTQPLYTYIQALTC